MKPQVKAFRNIAATTCKLRGFPFQQFMQAWRLEEILLEAETNNWPAKEIAGQVLFRCCVSGGKFNNFQVGLLAVMAPLRQQFGPLGQGETQAFTDLANTLNNPGNLQGITTWLNTHYP